MTDNDIVELYFERSESAIKETKSKYENLCKSIMLNIISNEQDAEECLNDTYLRLWNTIPPQKLYIASSRRASQQMLRHQIQLVLVATCK